MLKRLVAAALMCATSAWAQDVQPAPAPASDAAGPTATADASAPPATTPASVPTDPMELVAHALAGTREPAQCRFAFTRLANSSAAVLWSAAEAEVSIRFDPRSPIGQRWTVLHASRQQRAIERNLAREDRLGLPSDLIVLTVQGEWTYEDIAMKSEAADRYVYSYRPQIITARAASENGTEIIEQLVGELEVSRETGRVLSSALREPPEGAVRAGMVRVHRALLQTVYTPSANGVLVAESGTQMMAMSALLAPTAATTSFRFIDIEPICDAAEVARIAEAEAAVARAN